MSSVSICKALSSKSRWDILRSLFNRPMGVNEIAKEVGLQPVTVRHHLQPLIQVGLIEAYEKTKRAVGRPEVYYRLTEEHIYVSFPQRDYMFLSETIVSGLQSSLGEEETREIFTKIGEETGKDMIKGLAIKHGVKKWTPEAFKEFFIEGLLKELGTEPEVVSTGKKEVVYLQRNCIFLEEALKHPEIVCDGLDAGFYSGIIRGMGQGVEGKRLKCKGHGDPYCEFSVKWK